MFLGGGRGIFRDKTVVFRLVLLVDPFKGSLSIFLAHLTVLNDLTHLSIQKCVSDDHFFVLQVLLGALIFEGKIVKVKRKWSKSSVAKPLFILLQLLNECASDL